VLLGCRISLACSLLAAAGVLLGCNQWGTVECMSEARIVFTEGPRTLATAGVPYFQGLQASSSGLLGPSHGIEPVSVPPGTTVTAAGVSWTPGAELAGTTQRFVVRSDQPALCGDPAQISWSVTVLPPISLSVAVAPGVVSSARGATVSLVATFSGGEGALLVPFEAPLSSGVPRSLGTLRAETTCTVAVTNAAGDRMERSAVVAAQDPPTVVAFTAAPAVVTAGDPLDLTWSLTGTVTALTLDPGGPLEPTQRTLTTPAAWGGYTLTASNDAGDVATAAVSPEVVDPPAIGSLTASPPSVPFGGTTSIVAVFTGGAGEVTPNVVGGMPTAVRSGEPVTVGPLRSNMSYLLTVTNAAGHSVTGWLFVDLVGHGTWSRLEVVPAYGRRGHTATRLADGRVLVAGGATHFFGAEELPAETELFDPEAGALAPGPALLHPRQGHAAVLLADGRVLLAGGTETAGRPVDEAELLDVAAGRTSPAGSVGEAWWKPELVALAGGSALLHSASMFAANGAPVLRLDPAAGLLAPLTQVVGLGWVRSFSMPDGRVLLLSGGRYAPTPSQRLDPETGEATDTGATLREMAPFDAIQLADGRVLALDFSGPAEVYDPAGGGFAWTGAPTEVARGTVRGLALLADGRVLVVEGQVAELYDPLSGTFVPTGGPLGEDVLTALPDGTVLGTGGVGERYTP
jgi:hypothetical protein